MDDITRCRQRLIELQIEHRDLDSVIISLTGVQYPDELQLRRLKKRKLALKDEIGRLQALLTPDDFA